MAFSWDAKTIGIFAFKVLRFIVKKILSIILWIFLIIAFIAFAVQGQIWVAVGFAFLVAIIYVIRYLKLKLGEAKVHRDSRADPNIPSVDVSFKSPFDK